jgi:hypothetical protein
MLRWQDGDKKMLYRHLQVRQYLPHKLARQYICRSVTWQSSTWFRHLIVDPENRLHLKSLFFRHQVHNCRQARHGLQAVQLPDGDVLGRCSGRDHERRNAQVRT